MDLSRTRDTYNLPEASAENRVPLRPSLLFFRGIVALGFAALAVFAPGPMLVALSLWVGAFLIVDGAAALFLRTPPAAFRRSHAWAVLTGILGIVAGGLTFYNPIATAFALSVLLGAWCVVSGIFAVMGSVQMRSDPAVNRGTRDLMGVMGVASVVLGAIILFRPGLGAFTLVSLVALNALVIGVSSIALGFQMRKCMRTGACPPGMVQDSATKAA